MQGLHRARQDFNADGRGSLQDIGRLAVLIDEASASSSGIFAGAMQDNDRGHHRTPFVRQGALCRSL